MRMFSRGMWAVALAAVAAAVSPAMADYITNDTYIDNYPGTTAGDAPHTDVNYGGSAAIKAVTSPGSQMYPNADSAVRTLITLPSTLPSSFWSAAAAGQISSAILQFRAISINASGNTDSSGFSRTIAAYPLLEGFTAGTGHQPKNPLDPNSPPSTQGGTENLPGAPVGADWLTYDGANAWTVAGAPYDSADSATGSFVIANGNTYMQWDIAKLLDNPTTLADIENYGLMIRITDDTNYPATGVPQQFVSFYSYENANTAGLLASSAPSFTFTVVPEPASLALLAIGASGLWMRRGRRA